jgi:hypothetical protein
MYDMPDQSNSPKRLHIHVITEFLVDRFGVSKERGVELSRELTDALFDARWELISRQVMDAVLESGGVDPMILAKQYDNVQGAIPKPKPTPKMSRGM